MTTPQADAEARSEVRAVLAAAPGRAARADCLLEYLHRLDAAWGGLHVAHLAALAEELKLPLEQVLAVASRCGHFTVLCEGEQPAALRLTACTGLPCAMAGGDALRDTLPALLPPGIALAGSPCLGRCREAPVVLVGQVPVAHASAESVLNALVLEAERAPGEMGQVPVPADYEAYEGYRAAGGYALAAALAEGHADVARVLQVLEESGLQDSRGPVAAQWRQAQQAPAPRRLVVDLARGEPGAFAARELVEREPHRLLEGALIAALALGAEQVVIDVHPAWHAARRVLEMELASLRSNGSFAQPAVELQRGAATSWCTERSSWALPAALQLEFEPLFALRELLERGAPWWLAQGRRGHHGLRAFSVSGRVCSPGVKLAPAGITLRELVDEHCDGMPEGDALYAWLPGGASGGILPAQLADLPLDADTLQAHGAALGDGGIVVLGRQDKARDAALAGMRFFAAASCGQHAACAVAVMRAAQVMAAPRWDRVLLQKLQQEMAGELDCALARAAATALRCMHQHFPAETA
ncbi:NAD(P)H-dependent oxidoreductase subunit E [Ramlibacter sp. XY19]|uniref:NAD(P)H-dependent oxidoreductase subunit E n=1 Tax=Ramlibacter paludis TaxID=2908000 RepID=UPI0023DB1AA3|nr:NAD(P)H-dependent oxidoreductase subunit E [Ramlibacter paludis]MCG2592115.1 NAD(P)H-dependent oxidoreductase subunit E [Ramlibacter paludis]